MKTDAPKDDDYRIVELRASNFMRLHAVRIRPDGALVNITGLNEQGKTSTISAIAWALGGKEFAEAMPLRKGEDRGEVFVDLGPLRVTKMMVRADDGEVAVKLVVEYANGSRPSKPQTVIDELRGMLMDPIKFIKADGPKRIEMVKSLFPEFDFADNEKKIKDAKELRTECGREHKRAAAAAIAVVLPKGDKPDRVIVANVSAKLADAHAHNNQLRMRQDRRQKTAQEAERMRDQAERLRAEARALDTKADEIDAQIANAEALPAPIDTAPLVAAIGDAERISGIIALFENAEHYGNEARRLKNQYDTLTAQIGALDQERIAAISGGQLPYAGLAFGEADVEIDGIPFDQVAFSAQIRASAAIAIALEPVLKVMLIREFGSLLDKNSVKLLVDIASANNFQVWMETVGEGGEGKILIEDGRVAS